jgi:hypothetical protein
MANAWIIKPQALSAVSLVSGTTTVLGAPTNLGNDFAGVIWRSNTAASSVSLIFDMGADVTIDTMALFGILGPPTGAQMQIRAATGAQGSAFSGGVGTGANQYWQSVAENLYAGTVVPTAARRMALWSAPAVSGPPASRYWMLIVSSLSTNYVQLARAVFGKRFVPTRNFVYGGAFGVRDFGSTAFSNRAVPLTRKAPKQRTIAIGFANLYRDEVEATVQPLLEAIGGTDCIALVTDPAANAQRENRMYFGTLGGELGTIWRVANGHEWRVTLLSRF